MALPALHKTWQGGSTLGGTEFVNQAEIGTPASVLLAIKNAFTGVNVAAWTVIGSSDAAAAGMDGVDRWVNTGDITSQASANFSWIVLQQAGIAPKFQIRLVLPTTFADLSISYSHSGYGAANGGTDGSISQLPTALNERSVYLTNWVGGEGPGGETPKRLTIVQSTDGECSRAILSRTVNGLPILLLGVEKPRLPHAAWADPAIVYAIKSTVASNLSAFRWETMQETEQLTAFIGGVSVSLRIVGPMRHSGIEVIDAVQAGNPRFYSAPLVNASNISAPMSPGTLFDFYWVSRHVSGGHGADLDTFPLAGNRTFVCIGDSVIGWLNDGVTDLSYT